MISSLRLILTVVLSATLFTACNGIFSGIYDELPADEPVEDGFVQSSDDPCRISLRLDATDFTKWHFISLKNRSIETYSIPFTLTGEWDGYSGITFSEVHGENFTLLSMTPTDKQPEPAPDKWDFAIHRFDVRTNDGCVAATHLSSVQDANTLDISSLDFKTDIWTDNVVMVDLQNMFSYHIGYQNSFVNPILSAWVKMDISSPPPTYSTTGKVYLMRLADGTYAALKLRSYINSHGIKGHLIIDIIYPLNFERESV